MNAYIPKEFQRGAVTERGNFFSFDGADTFTAHEARKVRAAQLRRRYYYRHKTRGIVAIVRRLTAGIGLLKKWDYDTGIEYIEVDEVVKTVIDYLKEKRVLHLIR